MDVMQCPYCDRKFVDAEWTLRHVEREHAAEWAIDNDPGPTSPGTARDDTAPIASEAAGADPEPDPLPGPTATEPREDDEDSPVDPNGGLGSIGGTPRRIEEGNGPVKAPPPPPARTRDHRHKWTRTGEFADPSKPFASEVCLTCGSAERVYGRPEYSRPIPTIQVRRCPGLPRTQEDRGWATNFNVECGVEIPEDRTYCMFHSRALRA